MNILELQSLAQHSMALYDNKLMLFADIHKMKDVPALENSIINALVLALVTEGQINLVTEEGELQLKKGDLFASSPNYIIKRSMASMDFEALAIALSSEYCIELADMARLDWTFRSMMQQHEVIHLNDLQIDSFKHIFDFLNFKIQSPDTPNKGRCMDHSEASPPRQHEEHKADSRNARFRQPKPFRHLFQSQGWNVATAV